MKAFLMHPDRDFESQPPALSNEADLLQDLELDTLMSAMAGDDKRVFAVAQAALLHPLPDPDQIQYRQAALADCLANPETVRELYAFALESLQADRGLWSFLGGGTPESTLSSAQRSLGVLMEKVHDLRVFADDHRAQFESEAFTRLFDMLEAELTDEYFALVKDQLRTVEFRHGTLISAQLGRGNKGTGYVLRLTPDMGWRDKLARFRHPAHGFDIHPRDEGGMKALSELRSVALNDAANALAQSVDHIKSFFSMLATELAFYVGCLNLHDNLEEIGATTCQPDAAPADAPRLDTSGLYDVSLTLRLSKPAVGNDVHADGKGLIVVTGANQGGKSTFLRSAGTAQLMMQSGMFVGAESFTADVRDRVFTHYKREEDESMESGKFDEELTRMSAIADEITPRSLFLSNESFASTNEREGSEVSRQVVHALREAGVKIVFVTHLFDFAEGIRSEERDDVLFLRASRSDDGARPYKLAEEPPLPTSYGQDTYEAIFEKV
jgi:adenosyl cobinamide kinase/adenosyl cobinamide phosphate guanylyltransferase